MKKLKKLISVVLAVLLVFSAAACNNQVKQVFSGELDPAHNPLAAQRVDIPDSATIIGYSDTFDKDYVVVVRNSQSTKYGLYNVKTNEGTGLIYLSCTRAKYGIGIMRDSTIGSTNYGLVNYKGEVLLPFEYSEGDIVFGSISGMECVVIKGMYYEIVDNKIRPLNRDIANYNIYNAYKSDKYIYAYSDYVLCVFDANGKYLKTFETVENVETEIMAQQVFVMGGDNILIQSFTALPIGSNEKYDFAAMMSKFKLKTQVYNLKTGKLKTVKFNYIVGDSESNNSRNDDWSVYNESLKNNTVLSVMRIVDKNITGLGQDELTLVVDGNLKIKYEIPKNATSVKKIADNRYIISGGFEGNFITDQKGKIITALGRQTVRHISYGLVVMSNGYHRYGVVDKDGNIVVPYEYDDITNFFGNAIGRKSGQYFAIDREGNATPISANITDYSSSDGYYIWGESGNSRISNFNGNALLASFGSPQIFRTEEFIFVRAMDEVGKDIYYLLSQ